jgi:hypothetical protein
MKWLIVVLFQTMAGDVYIFTDPTFDTRDECMASVYNKDDQKKYIQKLALEYKKAMPIMAVNCLQEDKINEILEKYQGEVKKGDSV